MSDATARERATHKGNKGGSGFWLSELAIQLNFDNARQVNASKSRRAAEDEEGRGGLLGVEVRKK